MSREVLVLVRAGYSYCVYIIKDTVQVTAAKRGARIPREPEAGRIGTARSPRSDTYIFARVNN